MELYPQSRAPEPDRSLFARPSAAYRGAPFWSWNGTLDRARLLRQLDELRHYWRECRPGIWLFPGARPGHPLSRETPTRIFNQVKQTIGITKGRGIHTLRHYAEFRIMPSNVSLAA